MRPGSAGARMKHVDEWNVYYLELKEENNV
jgi:hypothetical protein